MTLGQLWINFRSTFCSTTSSESEGVNPPPAAAPGILEILGGGRPPPPPQQCCSTSPSPGKVNPHLESFLYIPGPITFAAQARAHSIKLHRYEPRPTKNFLKASPVVASKASMADCSHLKGLSPQAPHVFRADMSSASLGCRTSSQVSLTQDRDQACSKVSKQIPINILEMRVHSQASNDGKSKLLHPHELFNSPLNHGLAMTHPCLAN